VTDPLELFKIGCLMFYQYPVMAGTIGQAVILIEILAQGHYETGSLCIRPAQARQDAPEGHTGVDVYQSLDVTPPSDLNPLRFNFHGYQPPYDRSQFPNREPAPNCLAMAS